MSLVWKDMRYALRSLRVRPLFSTVIVLLFALGIGSTTAIFGWAYALLLRPLPYAQPDRLVVIGEYSAKQPNDVGRASYPNFVDWRAQLSGFEQLAAFQEATFNITGEQRAEQLQAATMTSNLFATLGVMPALGRPFRQEDEIAGQHRVVILSHGLFERRFGARAAIIGQTIQLNLEPYAVVGVMPAGFAFPQGIDLWMPIPPSDTLTERGSHNFVVIGRLGAGTDLRHEQAVMAGVARQLSTAYPATNADRGARALALREYMVGNFRLVLLTLFGAVTLVLGIACANIGNLLLARAASRRQEMAVRAALGASRHRIIRQLLVESTVLALAGGLGGLIVARAGTDLLARFVTVPAATAGLVTDTLDWPVLGFALLLALVTGVACGLAPVFQVSRTDLNDVLRQHGQGRTTFRRDWTRTSLVVSEVALSFVLLFGASLLLQSLMKLRDQPLGFQPDHALTLRVSLDFQRPWAPFYETALQRLDALPGVTAVGATYALPLKGASWVSGFTIEGHPAPAPGQRPNANYRVVSGGYFKAMGIPLQRGRVFTDRDREGTPRVAIVNEAFANRYFAGEDPIGQRLRIDTGRGVPREVVGIVGNVKHAELDVASAPEMYEPYLQKPMPMMSLVIRTQGDPALLIGPAQEALASVDRNQPISEVMTLDTLVASAVSQPQSRTVLVGAFGLCALVLTAIGLYGVMAYMVGQQIREIGVRMAFGATRATILEAVLGQGLRLAVMGVVLGALLTLWAARTLRTLLFEVNVLDPWSYLFVTVLLLAVSLLALWVPARRATTIDPLVALRYE